MIIADKMEELLIANWTKFIEVSKLMNFVLKYAKEGINKNSCLTSQKKLKKTIQITVSRFRPIKGGFSLWVDFSIPQNNAIAIGTVEIFLSPCGDISHCRTVGNLFIED